jgi:23S rRNA pseudouridine1911/1915/1917 synthase
MAPEDVPFDVLYEDSGLLIVDKPAGVVVHPGSGRKMGTLAAGLLYRYPDLEGVGQADRWGLVHRLDRDTSGALIVARTADTYESLSRMIRDRAVKRVYTTLVHGLFGSPTGMIDAPIGRDPSRPTRRAVVPGGKDARTHYEVSADYPVADCSLLTVRLETGRTHQIRVHLEAIDHPVVGDHTYSRRTTTVRPPRIFLHAASVEFPHPVTGVPVSAVSPLPPDLAAVLEELAQPAV